MRQRGALRRKVLQARDRLTQAARRTRSAALHGRLWGLAPFAAAEVLFIYVDFRSEVETLALIDQCLAKGKQVIVPLVAEDNQLIPCRLTALDELRPGAFGIPEPDPQRCARVAPGTIDLVLLPGSVFDAEGGRLGYGGGYYDRFLVNEAPQALRLGVCFELQLVEALPLLPHDQRLDILVTESRVLRFPPRH